MPKSTNQLYLTIFTLFTLSLFLVPYFLPRTLIKKAILSVSYWPQSPSNHLNLAKIYFKNSYPQKAKNEYTLAQNLYSKISFFDISKKTKNQFREVKNLFNKHQKIINQKQKLENLNNDYNNSPKTLLNLSLVYHQLLEDDLAKNAWKLAFYLNPNSPQTRLVKKIIFKESIN